jgi:hypothetical protein
MSNGLKKPRTAQLDRAAGEKIPAIAAFRIASCAATSTSCSASIFAGAERLGVARQGARWADAGKLGVLASFDRLDGQVDGLAQAIRFADYGASGFFDVVKIREEELDKLYQFDPP